MKKIILFLVIIFLLLTASFSDSQMRLRSSGLRIADAAILARSGIFGGILVITDGTNNASVIIYDNATTNTGTEVWKMTVLGAENYGGGMLTNPVVVTKGIYVDVSGTGAAYIIYYAMP